MQGHGGNLSMLSRIAGRPAAEILDFSANINPLGMPPCARSALLRGIDDLGHYPDPDCSDLVAAIGKHLGIDPARVVPGNGAEQLIWWLPRVVGARRVVVTAPAYLDYARAAAAWELPVRTLPLRADAGFALDPERIGAIAEPGDLVWIGHPNNPTGRLAAPGELRPLIAGPPEVCWAIDLTPLAQDDTLYLPNLVVVRSMTTFDALAGLRLGYAVMPAALAAAVRARLPDWSVNTLAQLAGTAILRDPALRGFAARTRALIGEQRALLGRNLAESGFHVHDSAANYLLLRLPERAPDAAAVAHRLLQQEGIAVRVCDDYAGLDRRYLRVAVRGAAENAALVGALGDLLSSAGG